MGALQFTQSSNKNEVPAGVFVCRCNCLSEEEAVKKPLLLPALGYPGFGYGYGALPYAAAPALAAPIQVDAPEITLPAPVQFKYVKNEIEIEVPVLKPELVETGCKNNFGNPVPCFLPGEARRKRSADEAPAAVAPLAYPYGGYPFYGGFGAYPY